MEEIDKRLGKVLLVRDRDGIRVCSLLKEVDKWSRVGSDISMVIDNLKRIEVGNRCEAEELLSILLVYKEIAANKSAVTHKSAIEIANILDRVTQYGQNGINGVIKDSWALKKVINRASILLSYITDESGSMVLVLGFRDAVLGELLEYGIIKEDTIWIYCLKDGTNYIVGCEKVPKLRNNNITINKLVGKEYIEALISVTYTVNIKELIDLIIGVSFEFNRYGEVRWVGLGKYVYEMNGKEGVILAEYIGMISGTGSRLFRSKGKSGEVWDIGVGGCVMRMNIYEIYSDGGYKLKYSKIRSGAKV